MFSIGKRMLRAEKRKVQQMEANLRGAGIIAAIAAVAVIVTMAATAGGRNTPKPEQAGRPVKTAGAEPLETALILPMSPELWEPQTLCQPEQPCQQEPQKPRYPLSDEQRDAVERVVTAEARGEDFDGKCLVAQCILNAAEAYGVQPSEVLRRDKYTTPADSASYEAKRAVAAVFDEGYAVTAEPVRWFYAPKYSAGEWHENNLTFVLMHGGHKFFKEGTK